METIDFSKTHKDLYTTTRKVKEVFADKGTFLSIEGKGPPGGFEFNQAVMAMYSVAYTVKFTLKMKGELDFKINKLECLYKSDPGEKNMDQWEWQLLIRVPDAVTVAHLKQAVKAVKDKNGTDVSAVKRIGWKEGKAVQVMHVGPYDQVHESYVQLDSFAKQHGLTLTCPAHEIYINDPRRVAAEKIKTIVRLSVKK
jgi:hypothetical protein